MDSMNAKTQQPCLFFLHTCTLRFASFVPSCKDLWFTEKCRHLEEQLNMFHKAAIYPLAAGKNNSCSERIASSCGTKVS